MAEHNVQYIERTFGELENGMVPNVNDPYGIMASLGPKMRDAVLHNPSGFRENEVCQILAVDNGIVIGGTNPFSGRLRLNGEVVYTQQGSYLFSHEDYRKDNVGGILFLRETHLHPTGNTLFAGISQMAMGLYNALRFTVFEIPRLFFLCKSRSVIQTIFHSEGVWTKPFIFLFDLFLIFHRRVLVAITRLRLRGFVVEKATEVPQIVEDIVLADKHPYMELHDKAWFEWNLKYTFSEDEQTKRSLFLIKNEGVVEAFFLTKQEFFKKASSRGFKNVYLGSVMEWGIDERSTLTEKDIYLLSLNFFDNNVDCVQFASADSHTVKQLKRLLLLRIGNANMAFKFRSINDDSIHRMENWRIRIAASDTLIN